MLYAILCYHDEDFVGSWSKEQDAAVMTKLAVVRKTLGVTTDIFPSLT